MSSSSAVLEVLNQHWPHGTPVTTSEVAEEFDCPQRTIYDKLVSLVDDGTLQMKQVGTNSHVWWQPIDPEQNHSEGSLKECSQVRSHPVFDSEMIGVIVWGEDVTIRDANDAFLDMSGFNYEEAIGMSWKELTPENFYSASKQHLSEVEESGSGVPYEKQYYRADGSRWWGLFESRRLNDSQKVELVVEITERRNREDELKAERQFIQQSLDALEDIFYVIDTDGRLQQWNEQARELTGRPESDLVNMPAVEFFPADEQDAIGDTLERILTDGKAIVEADILTAAGERVPHEFHGKRLTDTDGNTTGIVGIGRDLTERRRRERRFQALVEKSNDIISIVDTDGRYQYQSPSIERILGYQPAETIGDFMWEYIHPEDRETVRATFKKWVANPETVDSIEYRVQHADGSWQWIEARGNNQLANPAVDGYIITSRDVTARRERQKQLEKRERILRQLHAATREYYPLKSKTAIADFLVDFISETFNFEYISVKQYDPETGSLQPAARSVASEEPTELREISPSTNPVWEAYRQGTTQIIENETVADSIDELDSSVTEILSVPIGDFGILLTYATGDYQFDDVDIDLIEVVTAHAKSSFQRLKSEKVRTELAEEVSSQQTKADELRTLIETIQAIQHRLANSETSETLEMGVCEELLETSRVDFAWIGRPRGRDTHLDPSTWAGEGTEYLDSVELNTETSLVPAQRAADTRDPFLHANIPSLVIDESWAKEALSFGFKSVLSVPLVYDDVVYGVLTAYSREKDAFDKVYKYLLDDVASLLVNYGRILEQRYDEEAQAYTELEFELTDTAYPLQHIATETQSTIRLEAVIENSTDELRILVIVVDGNIDEVLDAARQSNSVVDVNQFGDSTNTRLTLTVQKPFLASTVGKHNGELVQAMSDEAGTTLQVLLPRDASNRPLREALSSRYREIEPVAKRQTETPRVLEPDSVVDILTDRQYEILSAAYYGGYYDTPRQVTGEDLAENFGISGSAIHSHLQSAHRSLLDQIF